MNIREILGKLARDNSMCSSQLEWDTNIAQAHQAIISAILEKIPKESMPPLGSLEDKYGYLAGQRKGYNQALAEMRERIKEK